MVNFCTLMKHNNHFVNMQTMFFQLCWRVCRKTVIRGCLALMCGGVLLFCGCTAFDQRTEELRCQNEVLARRLEANREQLENAKAQLLQSEARLRSLEAKIRRVREAQDFMQGQDLEFYQEHVAELAVWKNYLRLGTQQVTVKEQKQPPETVLPPKFNYYDDTVPKVTPPKQKSSDPPYKVMGKYTYGGEKVGDRKTLALPDSVPFPFDDRLPLPPEDDVHYWMVADRSASIVPCRFEVRQIEVILSDGVVLAPGEVTYVGVVAWETTGGQDIRITKRKMIALEDYPQAVVAGKVNTPGRQLFRVDIAVADEASGEPPFILEPGEHWGLVLPAGVELPIVWCGLDQLPFGDFVFAPIVNPIGGEETAWRDLSDYRLVEGVAVQSYPLTNSDHSMIDRRIQKSIANWSTSEKGTEKQLAQIAKVRQWQTLLRRCATVAIYGVPVTAEIKR